jgi:hypothetical protein
MVKHVPIGLANWLARPYWKLIWNTCAYAPACAAHTRSYAHMHLLVLRTRVHSYAPIAACAPGSSFPKQICCTSTSQSGPPTENSRRSGSFVQGLIACNTHYNAIEPAGMAQRIQHTMRSGRLRNQWPSQDVIVVHCEACRARTAPRHAMGTTWAWPSLRAGVGWAEWSRAGAARTTTRMQRSGGRRPLIG